MSRLSRHDNQKREETESRRAAKRENQARKQQQIDRYSALQPQMLEVKSKPTISAEKQSQTKQSQTIKLLDLSEMTQGVIPMTSVIDQAGNFIENDEKIKAVERIQNRLSGDRSPNLTRSPANSSSKSPGQSPTISISKNATMHKSSPFETKWGQLSASGMIKFGTVVGTIKDNTKYQEGSRKSPFNPSQPGNPQKPVVSVLKQVQAAEPATVVRKHQSPPAYTIAELPQHLNKSSPSVKITALKQNKSKSSIEISDGRGDSNSPKQFKSLKKQKGRNSINEVDGPSVKIQDSKRRQTLLGVPNRTVANKTSMPGIIYHVLNEETLQSNQGSEIQVNTAVGDSFFGQGFETSQDVLRQSRPIGEPTIMIGVGVNAPNARSKIGAIFTNSSETGTQKRMHLSGISNRKQMMQDARATYGIAGNESFQSIESDKKTTLIGNTLPIVVKNYKHKTPKLEKPTSPVAAHKDTTFFKEPLITSPAAKMQRRFAISAKRQSQPTHLTCAESSSATSKLMITLENAAERSMVGKFSPKVEPGPRNFNYIYQYTKEKPKLEDFSQRKLPPLAQRRHSEDNRLVMNVPRSLYFSNGYMPKLADLRDALRSNLMYHNRFNPELDTEDFKKMMAPALKPQPGEVRGKVDDQIEQSNVHDILIPIHKKKDDIKSEKRKKEAQYWANVKSRAQQEKTIDKLISIKAESYAKRDMLRQEEEDKVLNLANRFKAKLNPHVNIDTAEDVQKFLELKVRNPKRNALFNFMSLNRHNDVILPNSLFDTEITRRNRIEKIIQEENKKMRANDSEAQQFDRLKRQVEELVDQGFTFKKQTQKKKVKFGKITKVGGDNVSNAANSSDLAGATQHKRHLSLSPSYDNLSSQISVSNKKLVDFTILDNDYEVPRLIETRVRPDPSFQPISQKKPKNLKIATKNQRDNQKQHPEVPTKSPTEPSVALNRRGSDRDVTNLQLNQDIQINSPTPLKQAKNGTETLVKSFKIASSSRQSQYKQTNQQQEQQNQNSLALCQDVRLSKSDIVDLRKSREQQQKNKNFVQTHHHALRMSKEGSLEYERREEELTANDDNMMARASSSSKHFSGPADCDSQIGSKQNDQKRNVSFAEEKLELYQEVSLTRNASAAILVPTGQTLLQDPQDTDAKSDQSHQRDFGRGLAQSNSQQILPQMIDIQNEASDQNSLSKPFLPPNASQPDISQHYQASMSNMQPSLFGSLPYMGGQAREKLLKEKKIEMLHKPELNKSSCNHCITKAVKSHDEAMERIANSSIAGTTAAGTVMTNGGQTALNKAISQFLSNKQDIKADQQLEKNFSISQFAPGSLQYESTTMLQSEMAKSQAYSQLAKNAQSAIKGILAICDTHVKISKHTNEEFSQEIKKEDIAAEERVQNTHMAIDAILAAPDKVPTWAQIQESHNVDQSTDNNVIQEMVSLKRHEIPQFLVQLIRQNKKENKNIWKPVRIKHATEIQRFLLERFQNSGV